MRRAVLTFLLLGACGQGPSSPVFPACGAGRVLSTDSQGQLFCVPAPAGAIAPPKCTSALTSDGRQLSCTSHDESSYRDEDSRAALGQLSSTAGSLQQRIAALTATPLAAARFVGVTAVATRGQVQHVG